VQTKALLLSEENDAQGDERIALRSPHLALGRKIDQIAIAFSKSGDEKVEM
jgi:hypothetical protein